MNTQIAQLRRILSPKASTRGVVVEIRSGVARVATASGVRFVVAAAGVSAGDTVALDSGEPIAAPAAAAEVYHL